MENAVNLPGGLMKTPMLLIFGLAVTLTAAIAQDADLDAAKAAYAGVCATCHGPAGKGMASFPKLSGRDADYLASRLKQYRAGEKVGPNSPLMIPHAVNLSDDDIAGLSAYMSKTFP